MQLLNLIFELTKAVWGWIYLFSPLKLRIVSEGQGGVKFSWGKIKKNLKVGRNWGGMGSTFESFEVRLCKSEIDDAVTCFTQDAVPLELFAVFTYNIVDAGKFWTNSEDTQWLLAELVETRMREIVEKTTFWRILSHCETINKKLLRLVQKDSDELNLGIEVKRARLSHIKCTDSALLRAQSIDLILSKLSETGDLAHQKMAAAIISSSLPVQEVNNTQSVVEEAEE